MVIILRHLYQKRTHPCSDHALLECKIEGMRSSGRTCKNHVDGGGHNRMARIQLSGGNKESTIQEPLAATHYIRSSNAWNITTMKVNISNTPEGDSNADVAE